MSSKNQQKESFLPPLWILTIAFSLLVVWLLSELKEITIILVIGYAIAYVLDPILDFFEKYKISRTIGFFITTFLLVLATTIFITLALPPLVREFKATIEHWSGMEGTVTDRVESGVIWANSYLPVDKQLKFSREEMLKYLQFIDIETFKKVGSAVVGFLLEGYSIGLALVNLFLLPLIVFYLAIDLDRFHAWFSGLVPKSSKKTFLKMAAEIDELLRAFVVGQSTVCVVLAILYSLGFAIIGHSQWILMGAVSGLGNIVPYLGTASGIVLGIVFSLTSEEPVWMLVKTAIVFGVVQLLEGMVITPKIVGEKVGLSPLIVILAILIAGKLFGLLGIFLAVPAAATLSVMGSYAHRAVLKTSGD